MKHWAAPDHNDAIVGGLFLVLANFENRTVKILR